uniref:DUF131 domain-containing protein n=1 Tax=Ignisphaera aggregans TaxID=334771 RepID=A0A7C5Z039_9CREN
MINLLLLLFTLAFIIIFIGMILISISALYKSRKNETVKRDVEVGGVIVLGPIPIAFGTSQRIVKSLLIISITFFIIVIVLFIMLYSNMLPPKT